MTLNIRTAQKMFNIHPRSKTSLTAWEVADIHSCIDRDIKQIAQGIEWAIATGRITGTADMTIRKMSAYQTLKLLVDTFNSVDTMNDVPRYLNSVLNGE